MIWPKWMPFCLCWKKICPKWNWICHFWKMIWLVWISICHLWNLNCRNWNLSCPNWSQFDEIELRIVSFANEFDPNEFQIDNAWFSCILQKYFEPMYRETHKWFDDRKFCREQFCRRQLHRKLFFTGNSFGLF